MKWLTREQVKQAAKKGRKEAILCVLEHWRQLKTATKKELLRQFEQDGNLIHAENCALCERYGGKCSSCSLPTCAKSYSSIWSTAMEAFDDFFNDPSARTFGDWRKACRAMYGLTEKTFKRLYPKG